MEASGEDREERSGRVTTLWKPKRRWVVARRMGLWAGCAALVAWPVTIFGGGMTVVGPGHLRVAAVGGSLNFQLRDPPFPGQPIGSVFIYRTTGQLWLMPSLSWSLNAVPTATLTTTELITPFWVWGCGFLMLGWMGVRRCRPPRDGLCAKCDYDVRGLERGARCPECGSVLGLVDGVGSG